MCAGRQYHVDGRTTWTNPLQSVEAEVGQSAVVAPSSPALSKQHVEARISARHQERAATLALAAVVHQSPEIASKLVGLQKRRATRGRRKPPRRQAARQQQKQDDPNDFIVETATARGRGWALGLEGILEASSLADGRIDQLAFDEMVKSAERQQMEARTPRTPVGRPAGEDCPAPPRTPPPASGTPTHQVLLSASLRGLAKVGMWSLISDASAVGELASLVLSAQRADGTIDIDQLDRSITLEESGGQRGAWQQPRHDSKDLETLRLSVLGQTPPLHAGGRGDGGTLDGSSNVPSGQPTFAPYQTSPQTAQLVPLQERSANAVEASMHVGKPAQQKRRQSGGSGHGGRGGGCCGSRPK